MTEINQAEKIKRTQRGTTTSDLTMTAYVDGNAEIEAKNLDLDDTNGS